MLLAQWIPTKLGRMLALSDGSALRLLEFEDRKNFKHEVSKLEERIKEKVSFGSDEILKKTENELTNYFKGNLQEFSVPYLFKGTSFREKVWRELEKIPYGQSISYEELAKRSGNKKAFRAAANANASNNLALIVPCHRVINKSGALGGYAAGVERKQALLKLESL